MLGCTKTRWKTETSKKKVERKGEDCDGFSVCWYTGGTRVVRRSTSSVVGGSVHRGSRWIVGNDKLKK